MNQLIVIRITGQVDVPKDQAEALFRLRLRRKYAATLVKPTQANLKLLQKLRNLVAYGEINKETLTSLLEKRGKSLIGAKKIDVEKVIEQLDKKSLEELGVKPFFRLHPPLKGIDSKKHFGVGKGVLGYNGEKINELVRRML